MNGWIWLLCASALAGEWPMLDTLAEWADRSVQEYSLRGLQPYRAEVALLDRDAWFVEATMGALISDQGWRTRPGRVEVVVGSLELDSSRFDGPGSGGPSALGEPLLGVDDVPIAPSPDLWLVTDASSKAAVKQHQVKEAALAQLGGAYPPDWSAATPVTSVDMVPLPALDAERLRDVALRGSAALRALGGLRNGRVQANSIAGHYVLVTSEGTRLVQPESHAVVYAWADLGSSADCNQRHGTRTT